MKYDLRNPYRVVSYARMSSKLQNEKSPESQIAMICDRYKQLGCPWTLEKTYIDRAMSGRFDNRPGLRQMLRDIRTGVVKVDLVLVDTIDRFSRSKRLRALRDQLEKQNVLIVTADSSFADPTTFSGRVMSHLDEARAQEDGRIKGHMVKRGKQFILAERRWPGGPVPLGFKLLPVMSQTNGTATFAYHAIEPDIHTKWIVEEAFRMADEQGWGASRIAQTLNDDPLLVQTIGKKLSTATVGEMLKRLLYTGEMLWNTHTGAVIDDVLVLTAVPEAEWTRVPNYCEPIVTMDRWERANMLREARAARQKRAPKQEPKIGGLSAPGIALKYPLSGLLICSHCQRAMTVSSGRPYVAADGQERRYVYYGCSGHKQGKLCSNGRFVPEPWIREEVFALVKRALGLDAPQADSPAVRELLELVQAAFAQLRSSQPNRFEALEAERVSLSRQVDRWVRQLGQEEFPERVRAGMKQAMQEADVKLKRIETELHQLETNQQIESSILDTAKILERLRDLSDVMAGANPAATSLYLAQHIAGVHCAADGTCEIRLCKLGALAGDLDYVPVGHAAVTTLVEEPTPERGTNVIEPRRRTKRDARAAILDDDVLDAANDIAVNPYRFAGLPPEFFVSVKLTIPEPVSWAEEHSDAVAEFRRGQKATIEETAEHFGVSVPTIRKALRSAQQRTGEALLGKLTGKDNKRNWAKQNAADVAAFMAVPGTTKAQATKHFGVSDPTIKKALEYASGERR